MRAALLDALGTLVELERPWPHLVAELRTRGVSVGEDDARRAMLAEMAYYKRHHDDARDFAGLKDLRRRCAGIVQAELGTALPVDAVEDAMLAAIRFRPYPEVPEVLAALRDRGVARVVVSNWDVSLHEVMERTGLRALVDAVLTSAEIGEAKPGGAMFRAALELAGARPAEAVHVGDSIEHDVAGALAIGMRPVLVDRDGTAGAVPEGVPVVSDLTGVR